MDFLDGFEYTLGVRRGRDRMVLQLCVQNKK
jgi:hypothetical protein